MSATKTYWFRPKRTGYGAQPNTWQGWLVTWLFVLVIGAVAWLGIVGPAFGGGETSTLQSIATWIVMFALTAGFVWLSRVKTDGTWEWRQGGKPLSPKSPSEPNAPDDPAATPQS